MEQTPNTSTTPTSDEKTLALLSHILCLVGGFIPPLIIWLIKKDDSKFVSDSAKESLNFQITIFIAYVVCWVLALILIGFILMFAVMIFWFVMIIIATVETNKGKLYRYPINIRIIS